ncbi:MAG: hypothetical protein QM582_03980 [Micropruina sp.]
MVDAPLIEGGEWGGRSADDGDPIDGDVPPGVDDSGGGVENVQRSIADGG